ncbi:MAG: hypothetical protein K5905_30650, partial [Roseibium sp.]
VPKSKWMCARKSFLPGSLVTQIIVGLSAGVLLAAVWPEAGMAAGLLGDFFVDALKAIAPVLVLILVCAAITNHKKGSQARMGPVGSPLHRRDVRGGACCRGSKLHVPGHASIDRNP